MKIAILCCIFALLFVSSINGTCKRAMEMEEVNNTHITRDTQRVYQYPSARPAQASTSNALKFMTFNMQSGFKANCQSDVVGQATFVKSIGADYFASQEIVQGVSTRCNCNMPSIMADTTGMASCFAMAIGYGTGYYGINAATSQNILETRYQLLAYSGVEQRTLMVLRTQPPALNGRNLWFASVHVDYYNTAARYSQIQQIIDFMNTLAAADPQAVLVLGGDFNGGPWDTGYDMMKRASYQNSWEVFNGRIEGGNTIPVGDPGSRFDHIWYRVPAGVTVSVTNAFVPEVLLSDHRPYVATLVFNVGSYQSATQPPATQAPATKAPATQAPATQAPATAAPATWAPATAAPATRAPATAAPATAAPPPVAPSTRDTVVCVGPVYENSMINIKCPYPSQVMKQTQFANYGINSGSCQAFQAGWCVGGSSTAVVNDKCIGRNSCSFLAANNVFGDPCPRNGKEFRVQVLCSEN